MKKWIINIFLIIFISTVNAQINPNGGFENGLMNWKVVNGNCKIEVVESFIYNDSIILPFEGKKFLRVHQNNGTSEDCVISTKMNINSLFINEYQVNYASIFLSSDSNLKFKDREIYHSGTKYYKHEYFAYKNPVLQYNYGGLSKSLDLRKEFPNNTIDSIELQFIVSNMDTIGFDLLLDKVEYFIKTSAILNNNSETFNIFPNPSNGVYSITGFKVKSANVFDINGRLIETLENEEQNTLDLTHLKNGLYLMQLCDDNDFIITKRIVKQ